MTAFGPAVAVCTFALGISACADRDAAPAFIVRDSAGIQVAESVAPQWDQSPAWLVDTIPRLDLATSGPGPAHQFFQVRDATRLTNGSIVVADEGSGQVRFFSVAGSSLGTIGRDGEGPGEFRELTSIHRIRNDSVVAFDRRLRRITVFTPDRQLARMVSLFDDYIFPRWFGVLQDTTLVVTIALLQELLDEEGLVRERNRVMTLGPEGRVLDTLATVSGFESFEMPGVSARALLARDAHLTTHAQSLYIGTADSMEYRVLSPTGTIERIVRVPGYDLRLTPEQVQAERDAIKDRWPPNPPRSVVETEEALPHPETRPAYADLIVDDAGFVWVAEHHGFLERDEPTDWQIFSPHGEWMGSIRLPARFTTFEIGRDYILGVRLDELDVEHVQVLALTR